MIWTRAALEYAKKTALALTILKRPRKSLMTRWILMMLTSAIRILTMVSAQMTMVMISSRKLLALCKINSYQLLTG